VDDCGRRRRRRRPRRRTRRQQPDRGQAGRRQPSPGGRPRLSGSTWRPGVASGSRRARRDRDRGRGRRTVSASRRAIGSVAERMPSNLSGPSSSSVPIALRV
jgi:hypothetical protein